MKGQNHEAPLATAGASWFACSLCAHITAKGNATAGDLASDMDRCASLARTRFPTGDPSISDAVSLEMEQAMRRQTFVSKCMHGKGWH
jgi:hypothetical protein